MHLFLTIAGCFAAFVAVYIPAGAATGAWCKHRYCRHGNRDSCQECGWESLGIVWPVFWALILPLMLMERVGTAVYNRTSSRLDGKKAPELPAARAVKGAEP